MRKLDRFMTAALAAAGLAVLSVLSVAQASGQSPTGDDVVTVASESAISTAEQLRARADELNGRGEVKNFAKMKRLYEAAARAAPENDLQRSNDLYRAGQIAFYMQDFSEAQRLLVSAAETARDFGDVFQAGKAYLDAALATAQLGNREYALELLHRGKMLAQSPLLQPPYCDCLLQRVALLEGLESATELLEG